MAAITVTPMPAEDVARVMAALPPRAQQEVLNFALFLQTRIAADDATWDAAFASTDPAKLKAWLEAEKADDDDLRPMFDEAGEIAI